MRSLLHISPPKPLYFIGDLLWMRISAGPGGPKHADLIFLNSLGAALAAGMKLGSGLDVIGRAGLAGFGYGIFQSENVTVTGLHLGGRVRSGPFAVDGALTTGHSDHGDSGARGVQGALIFNTGEEGVGGVREVAIEAGRVTNAPRGGRTLEGSHIGVFITIGR